MLLVLIKCGHGDRILVYVWCAVGAVGLVAWGIRESRAERINLGVAGFAITGLALYLSIVMDKMGRSASLVVLGLVFLRRRLAAGANTPVPDLRGCVRRPRETGLS
jgi:hypothetical protein